MLHWLNISCAYTRGIAAYICKIWSFYDQICHWEGCTNADADADNADTDDDTDTDDDDNDNDTRRTEHDCIGSLPNEPKN